MPPPTPINRPMRLLYAFFGFVAGEAVLLALLLINALTARASLIEWQMGEPGRQVPFALEMFSFLTSFAFLGWLLIGVPIALFIPTARLARLIWPLRALVGLALGPIGVVIVTLILSIRTRALLLEPIEMVRFVPYAIVVSLPAFLIFAALAGSHRHSSLS